MRSIYIYLYTHTHVCVVYVCVCACASMPTVPYILNLRKKNQSQYSSPVLLSLLV